MKCRYKYCRLGGEVEKDVAIKIGSAYYHQECRKEIKDKEEIEKVFYDRFNINEGFSKVKGAINKYVGEFDTSYILYVLHQDIKLNSIYGLVYYLRDSRFRAGFEKEKAKLIKFDIDKAKIEKPRDYIPKREATKKMWGDLL